MNRNVWVMDVETLASCFTYTGYNIDTAEIVQYVLHKDRFELQQLVEHLNSCKGHIGFNNINFDYPIIHYILKNILGASNRTSVVQAIYKEAQRIIEEQNKQEFNTIIAIKQQDVKIPQLDLFKIWHYNNKARSTSLKALEISMNYPNVMEMPILHTREDITLEEIPSILEYNLNDVLATYEFYLKSIDKINLRKELIKQYRIPCLNWSDSKIGEQLVLKLYCDYADKDVWEVKKLRTHNSSIQIKDILFDYIEFETSEFRNIHEFFKNLIITETKGTNKSVLFNNIPFDFGLGGIHACIKPGVYESDKDYIIKSADVVSLYPNLSIKNNLFIAHLGHDFCKVYQSMLDKRLEAKKAKNNVLSDGFKLAANSVYGKSNDINSFLFDSKFTMSITINGQLLLTMLSEKLSKIPDSQILMVNTDGLEIKIPRTYEDLYNSICKDWEKITNLTLEYIDYSKMIISDVNNYIAVTTDNKVKNKGRFEDDKVVGSEPAYHKDNSFRIIPLALQEYFTKGISVKDSINNHTNIYDFCGRQKFTKDSYGQIHYLDLELGKEIIEKQQKNTRYYISKSGATFVKYYKKGTTEMINKGYKVQVFNKYFDKDMKDYNIDYSFYIKECNKEIQLINNKQLKLL